MEKLVSHKSKRNNKGKEVEKKGVTLQQETTKGRSKEQRKAQVN